MKFLLVFVFLCSPLIGREKTPLIYLSWHEDPTSTMTVRWITDKKDTNDHLAYRLVSQDKKTPSWIEVVGHHSALPEKHPHTLHRVELQGLSPNTMYQFRVGKSDRLFRFKTMPQNLDEPVRFVVGGDAHGSSIKLFRAMSKQAAKAKPRFAIVGGDIAYSQPSSSSKKKENFSRWRDFFKTWMQEMVDEDGCLIPMFTAIGNHEVLGRYHRTAKQAPLYYAFFARSPTKCYYDFGFGWYAHFIFLDSGHTAPVKGKQADWLKGILKKHKTFKHRFAIYHVGAYPSNGDASKRIPKDIRKYWVPHFEKYHINACFEHHDHAYKRTHPLINGRKKSGGIVYFGDGSWGVQPRKPNPKRSYLAHSAESQQVIVVELRNDKRLFWSIDPKGKILDTYEQKVE